jgi:hypothetical protein
MPTHLTYMAQTEDVPQFEGLGEAGLENAVKAAVVALGVISIGAWLFTGIVAADSVSGKLRWLGIMLVLPSLVVLLIGLGISSTSLVASGSGVIVDGGMNDRLSQTVTDALIGGVGRISMSFLAAGAIPAAIGGLLFVLGIIVPSRRRDDLGYGLQMNPTTQYGGKPKNDFEVFNKPKNDGKVKNDDIIKPL